MAQYFSLFSRLFWPTVNSTFGHAGALFDGEDVFGAGCGPDGDMSNVIGQIVRMSDGTVTEGQVVGRAFAHLQHGRRHARLRLVDWVGLSFSLYFDIFVPDRKRFFRV